MIIQLVTHVFRLSKGEVSLQSHRISESVASKCKIYNDLIVKSDQSQFEKFPTAPLYGINEEVYIIMAGQAQPAGPYLISSILANGLYRLRYKGTGDALNQSIAEKDLVIRTS